MNKLFILFIITICFKTEAQTSVLNVADSLYVNGNYSKAITEYKKHEDQKFVLNKIAKAYVAIGNYDLALFNYQEYLKANEDDYLAKFEYARLLSKTKKFKKAFVIFNELIDVDYRNPNYHYELGLVQEKLGDSTAQNRFYSTYQLDSTHQKAIYKLARYNLKKRNHKLVDTYLDKGLESYENNIELISLKAQNYYYQQYYKQAAIWFEKLIDAGESSEFIHEKLSLCYADNFEYVKAIEQRKLALEYSSNNPETLYVIGKYYDNLEDFINAEKYYSLSLQLKDVPLDHEYSMLAGTLLRQKKYEEGIVALKKAIKENPENELPHFYLASAKDKYYADIDSRIKVYEDFKNKFPKSGFIILVDMRLKKLKEEKFLKEE